jgi:hypothetical protein
MEVIMMAQKQATPQPNDPNVGAPPGECPIGMTIQVRSGGQYFIDLVSGDDITPAPVEQDASVGQVGGDEHANP